MSSPFITHHHGGTPSSITLSGSLSSSSNLSPRRTVVGAMARRFRSGAYAGLMLGVASTEGAPDLARGGDERAVPVSASVSAVPGVSAVSAGSIAMSTPEGDATDCAGN